LRRGGGVRFPAERTQVLNGAAEKVEAEFRAVVTSEVFQDTLETSIEEVTGYSESARVGISLVLAIVVGYGVNKLGFKDQPALRKGTIAFELWGAKGFQAFKKSAGVGAGTGIVALLVGAAMDSAVDRGYFSGSDLINQGIFE
ncbi:MAG: hypothetical protein AAF203_10915, partial [Pseudomonadota bacterium]